MRVDRARVAAIAAAVVVVALPAGCGSDDPSTPAVGQTSAGSEPMAGTGDAPAGESPVGTWGVEAQGQPYLTLGEDGRVSGSDGCNRIMGDWQQEDTIVFTGLASTKMFCEGVDTWLGNAASA